MRSQVKCQNCRSIRRAQLSRSYSFSEKGQGQVYEERYMEQGYTNSYSSIAFMQSAGVKALIFINLFLLH